MFLIGFFKNSHVIIFYDEDCETHRQLVQQKVTIVVVKRLR